jgi:hypothetical protein
MYVTTVIFISMKYPFCLLLLLPLYTIAQDCKLKNRKDPYTREIKLSTGFIQLGGAQVSMEGSKSEVDFMFSFGSGKCFDDACTAALYYEGSKVKNNFKNNGTMNCDGLFHFTFRNTNPTPSALQNLATKKVTSIHFKDNTKKEIVVTLTAEQQQIFASQAACIISETKKLLQ